MAQLSEGYFPLPFHFEEVLFYVASQEQGGMPHIEKMPLKDAILLQEEYPHAKIIRDKANVDQPFQGRSLNIPFAEEVVEDTVSID